MSDAAMCLHKEFVHICPVVAQTQGEWVRTRGRHWIRVCVCVRVGGRLRVRIASSDQIYISLYNVWWIIISESRSIILAAGMI